jgi:hypothetical protein
MENNLVIKTGNDKLEVSEAKDGSCVFIYQEDAVPENVNMTSLELQDVIVLRNYLTK